METNIVFISGGARSGKSTFAEQFAERRPGKLHYIATARMTDDEMEGRIRRHQKKREYGERSWATWECPVDIHTLAPRFHSADIVLLDCLTILLANELFRSDQTVDLDRLKGHKRVVSSLIQGIDAIAQRVHTLVIVSNEVLFDGVSNDPVVKTYQRAIGYLHQDIVKRARCAFAVEAGIPLLMKEERHG